jgi:hypothetical protein
MTEATDKSQLMCDLVELAEEGMRAIGDHTFPTDCYATGPLTGNAYKDLIECPACSFIVKYESVKARLQGMTL